MELALRKLLLFFLVGFTSLFGYQYNSVILDIEAKIFPKIALMEKSVQNSPSKSLHIIIVYKKINAKVAKKFQSKIEMTYKAPLLGKKIVVDVVLMRRYHKLQMLPDVIIVLSYPPKEMKDIAKWANENKIVSFVYEPKDLQYGFLGSVYIGLSVKPYLNKETIKESGFVFTPYLLQLSKF